MKGTPIEQLPDWIGNVTNLGQLSIPDSTQLDGKPIPKSIVQTSLWSLDLGGQCMVASAATAAWLDTNAPNWDVGCSGG